MPSALLLALVILMVFVIRNFLPQKAQNTQRGVLGNRAVREICCCYSGAFQPTCNFGALEQPAVHSGPPSKYPLEGAAPSAPCYTLNATEW